MSFDGLNQASLLGIEPGIEFLGDVYIHSVIDAVNQFCKKTVTPISIPISNVREL